MKREYWACTVELRRTLHIILARIEGERWVWMCSPEFPVGRIASAKEALHSLRAGRGIEGYEWVNVEQDAPDELDAVAAEFERVIAAGLWRVGPVAAQTMQ
jgi:hypothetical protein